MSLVCSKVSECGGMGENRPEDAGIVSFAWIDRRTGVRPTSEPSRILGEPC
jgi:hypothetical protein